jgi:hypothetical protein
MDPASTNAAGPMSHHNVAAARSVSRAIRGKPVLSLRMNAEQRECWTREAAADEDVRPTVRYVANF